MILGFKQVLVDILVKRAYDNWNHVIEYDGKALQSSINISQKAQTLPTIADYNTPVDRYFMPTRQIHHLCPSDTGTHVETQRTQASSSAQLALEISESSYPATCPSRDWSCTREDGCSGDHLYEEEIRMMSTEISEHDDMQHLLRSFTLLVGGNASEPCYSYTNDPLEPQGQHVSGNERNRGNAKAVISWVKLKAAFRWGIFTRKRAAQRRAQIVELD